MQINFLIRHASGEIRIFCLYSLKILSFKSEIGVCLVKFDSVKVRLNVVHIIYMFFIIIIHNEADVLTNIIKLLYFVCMQGLM